MRHEAIHSFGCLCNAKPAVLCELYYCITGDSLASTNVQQEQVDECVRLALDCKDEDIIWDLCEKNEEKLAKYDVFWDHCQKYIDSKLEAAADEWRHDTCVHFAVAMSVRDFVSEVAKLCPDNTPIPYEKWVCLQFWPKDPKSCHHSTILDALIWSSWFRYGFSEELLMSTALSLY